MDQVDRGDIEPDGNVNKDELAGPDENVTEDELAGPNGNETKDRQTGPDGNGNELARPDGEMTEDERAGPDGGNTKEELARPGVEVTEDERAGPGRSSIKEERARDVTKDEPTGLDYNKTQDKPAGPDGDATKDEPEGRGEDENKVKETDKWYKRPVISKEEKNPNKTEAKYQAKTGIGTNGRQENKEIEAKYQAKAEAKDQDVAKDQSHRADNKTHTGTLVKNLAEEKETEGKQQKLVNMSFHSTA